MEAALRFYGDLVGLEVLDDAVVDEPEMSEFLGLGDHEALRAVMLSASGGPPYLELFQFLGAKDASPRERQTPLGIGSSHPCFLVSDIQQEYQRLSAAGVQFTRPPMEIDGGPFEGQWILYGFDPDGSIVEFWSIPGVSG
jgi:glyoxylase I family protein